MKCGAEVKPNYKFCTKCGQPMTADQPAQTKSNPIENEVESDSGEKLFGINFGRREKEPKPQGARRFSAFSNKTGSSKRVGTNTIGAPWNILERLYLNPEK